MRRMESAREVSGSPRLVLLLTTVLLPLVLVTTPLADDPALIAAGDIAGCASPGSAATAALIDRIPGTVLTLGDTAYPDGSAQAFTDCYAPTWGRFNRTHPAPGNHDYMAEFAKPYFDYFGVSAGARSRGYYSYDMGTWHIIALNSNCAHIGGCKDGAPEVQWLKADLAAHPAECTLAYWHHPLFGSSPPFTGNPFMLPIWQVLYDAHVDVVLNGHAHNYERLAPLDANGAVDPQNGIREFIVGTGGEDHLAFSNVIPASQAHNSDAFGVLKLTLHPGSYDWQFIPEAGKTFTDSGSGICH